MFISKLVCDKCGTEASASDKFCRECGEKGTSLSGLGNVGGSTDVFKKLIEKARPDINTITCRTCGEKMDEYSSHICKGLFGRQYDDGIRWATGIYTNDTSGKGTILGARIVCDRCNKYVRADGHNCKATPDTKMS